MTKKKSRIIQHTDTKIDIGSLFCRGNNTHIDDFENNLQIFKGAESIHLYFGANSLFDRAYLALANALINPEALDYLKKAKRVLLLYEGSPDCEHPLSIDDLRHIQFFNPLFTHLEYFRWDYVENNELGDTINVYVFIIS